MTCEAAEFFQMSGLKVTLEIGDNNQGSRVAMAEVKSKHGNYSTLKLHEIYKIAITSFLTLPGKSLLADLATDRKVGITDYVALVNYLNDNSPIQTHIENRINVNYFNKQ